MPSAVFAFLVAYLVATSAVLGYFLIGQRRRVAAAFTLVLLGTSFLLILDIDRPRMGSVQESQLPMEMLRDGLMAQPSETFDRYTHAIGRPTP